MFSPQTGYLRFFYLSSIFSVFPNVQAGCKHYPRCSDYFLESINKFGFIYGSWNSIKRIINCR